MEHIKITKEANEVIAMAYAQARKRSNEYITPEHLLYAILIMNQKVADIIENLGGNIERIRNDLEQFMEEELEKTDGKEPKESTGFKKVVFQALQIALTTEQQKLTMKHLISSLYDLEESYAVYFLEKEGIEKQDVLFYFDYLEETEYKKIDIDEREEKGDGTGEYIKKYAVDLNKLVMEKGRDPLIGREDILDRTIEVLLRKTKNNPLHVGEAGVGKTAITLGLAKRIEEGKVPEQLKDAKIYSINMGSLLAGTKYRGDFEERIKNLLDEILKEKQPIVYIDEIHTVAGTGSTGNGTTDAANLLKPYLLEGKLRFIGATTYEEYKKYFEKDRALARRFNKIDVREMSPEETKEILLRLKENYEDFHHVKYEKNALESAVILSKKYMNDRFLPDKAIDLIDEAGAYAFMHYGEGSTVDRELIEEILAKNCNIPKQTLESDERKNLESLEQRMKQEIFGQDEAVESLLNCIKMSKAGLNEENKPIAKVLFVGPTGVGKTEIAKCLAKEQGMEFVRFDMSEYSEKHAASKLIGSPPGYVGYEEGGMLVDVIRKKPYCVLLLDEVEKAHEDILNVLLQVMDYATLTDNQGRKADFRNVVLIMTSNAGAKNVGKKLIGFNDREVTKDAVMEAVKKGFTPEFRNRLDKIIVFHHIDGEMAVAIAKKELKKLEEQLKEKNIRLEFAEEGVKRIAKEGLSKEYGAREILRIIQTEIKPILVEEILFGKLKNGGKGRLDYREEKWNLTIES